MFSLVSGLWEWVSQRAEVKVLILGVDNAGKTHFLEDVKQAFNGKSIPRDRITPTCGFNTSEVAVGRSTKVILWDLGGKAELRSMWRQYYDQCDLVLFVVDFSDPSRYAECSETMSAVVAEMCTVGRSHIPVVLLANKMEDTDEADAASESMRKELCLSDMQTKTPVQVLPLRNTGGDRGEEVQRVINILLGLVRQCAANPGGDTPTRRSTPGGGGAVGGVRRTYR
eukprot:GHVU01025207.1.p1 GENE.GHVU01025207.1~~GHVU01025207.1.p1  ORF type:complete len:226 (+),score=26.62 GHVU01025207.1:503-1180(+)